MSADLYLSQSSFHAGFVCECTKRTDRSNEGPAPEPIKLDDTLDSGRYRYAQVSSDVGDLLDRVGERLVHVFMGCRGRHAGRGRGQSCRRLPKRCPRGHHNAARPYPYQNKGLTWSHCPRSYDANLLVDARRGTNPLPVFPNESLERETYVQSF